MKYTNHNLKKIEEIYKATGYVVRYGKGNFQAGYCILDAKNIVVVNKFYNTEAKINALIDILTQVDIKEELLDAKTKKMYDSLLEMRGEI